MKPIWAGLVLLILSGCLKDESVSGQTDSDEIWHLVAVNGSKTDGNYTLQFPERGKLSGAGPCNDYQAQQTAPLPWFEVKNLKDTGKSCDQIGSEKNYLETLTRMTFLTS